MWLFSVIFDKFDKSFRTPLPKTEKQPRNLLGRFYLEQSAVTRCGELSGPVPLAQKPGPCNGWRGEPSQGEKTWKTMAFLQPPCKITCFPNSNAFNIIQYSMILPLLHIHLDSPKRAWSTVLRYTEMPCYMLWRLGSCASASNGRGRRSDCQVPNRGMPGMR